MMAVIAFLCGAVFLVAAAAAMSGQTEKTVTLCLVVATCFAAGTMLDGHAAASGMLASAIVFVAGSVGYGAFVLIRAAVREWRP